MKRTATGLLVLLSLLPIAPAAAWHSATWAPPDPQVHIKNLSVTVGQKAWVLTVRTAQPEKGIHHVWYLDVGDDGPGRHRGAEYLLSSSPGEVLLFTLPTADQSSIGGLACTLEAAPLKHGPGQKIRVPQSCVGAPERLRVRLSASAGEDSVSWSPRFGRDNFHPVVDNVAHPVA